MRGKDLSQMALVNSRRTGNDVDMEEEEDRPLLVTRKS